MENSRYIFRAWSNLDSCMINSHDGYFLTFDGYLFKESDKKYNTPYIEIERVKHLILMQYSDQTDKNGKQICEGDILSDKWKCEVYINDEGTFMVRFHANTNTNKPMSLKKYLAHNIKAGTSDENNLIIGNIFENPEQIEKL